jgi:hypothetical protein
MLIQYALFNIKITNINILIQQNIIIIKIKYT